MNRRITEGRAALRQAAADPATAGAATKPPTMIAPLHDPARLESAASKRAGDAASRLVIALEAVWAEIRRRHPDVPAVIVTVGAGSIGARPGASRVRRALNYAVDRREITRLAGGPDLAQPTCQLLPPGFPNYRPSCPYTLHPSPGGGWSAPDLERARRLIEQSGTKGTPVSPRRRDPLLVGLVADHVEALVEVDVDLGAVGARHLDLVGALLVAGLGPGDLAAAGVLQRGGLGAVERLAADRLLGSRRRRRRRRRRRWPRRRRPAPRSAAPAMTAPLSLSLIVSRLLVSG